MPGVATNKKSAVILVVDDHHVTRNLVKSILKGIGYEHVLQAENGHAAIKMIFDEKIDLVICDWNMPSLSGLDVLKKIRSDAKYKNLPFLMLTAEAYRENVSAALQLGVTDYMIKPFTAETLMS
jgi:two-component system, chemotaxis family, chemotaxis protein CheY